MPDDVYISSLMPGSSAPVGAVESSAEQPGTRRAAAAIAITEEREERDGATPRDERGAMRGHFPTITFYIPRRQPMAVRRRGNPSNRVARRVLN